MKFLESSYNCVFSKCRRYRYVWRHVWDNSLPRCAFIGLNPSTADEEGPDPTVRRSINYAKTWGYGALIMLNLFGLRATDPKIMLAAKTPIGPRNNQWIWAEVNDTRTLHGGIVIAAWGNHGAHLQRSAEVRRVLSGRLYCLSLTKSGEPAHPLYLKGDLKPMRWR